MGRVGGMRRLGGLGQVRRVGVRAKASECMELGVWGDCGTSGVFFCFCGLSFVICNYFVSLSLENYN